MPTNCRKAVSSLSSLAIDRDNSSVQVRDGYQESDDMIQLRGENGDAGEAQTIIALLRQKADFPAASGGREDIAVVLDRG